MFSFEDYHPAFALVLLSIFLCTESPIYYQCDASPLSSRVDDPNYQTIYQQSTLFHNPIDKSKTEITVIDPRHPLYNRTFSILSVSDPNFSQGHAYVIYREGVTLRIPFSVTDIFGHDCTFIATKLTSSSIEALVSLAQECKIPCHPTPTKSGNDYCPVNDKLSSPN